MKIILLRHGRVDINETHKVKAKDLHKWIDRYNSCGIKQSSFPASHTLQTVKNCNAIVCSDYQRSIQSSESLGLHITPLIDPLFREVGLPYSNWNMPKLNPSVWAAIFRVLWFTGYNSNSESYSKARERAIKAAYKLESMADELDSVLLVGHGFMNNFIAKQLRSRNWSGPHNPGRKFWDFAVYEKN